MNARKCEPGSFRRRTQTNSSRRNKKVALAAAVGAIGLQLFPLFGSGPRIAQAATYTWDPGNTPATPSGGPGTWNLVGLSNWSNGTIDSQWTDNSPTGTDTAIFDGAAGGTVTLSSSLSASGLIFQTAGYKISGTSTLTLGSGGVNTFTGTTTLAAPIALAANQFWNIGSGSTVLDTSPISGATFGINQIGGGTLKLNAASTYTGTTTVANGTVDLNFGASGAATSNILSSSSSLSLGGGTLQLDLGAKTTSPTQTFTGTTLTPALSAVTITNTVGTGTPVVNLGAITATQPGAALILTGPATIGMSNALVPAVGKITIGKVNTNTQTASGVLEFKTGTANPGVAGADWATVGQYDFAAIDPTGAFVEGGSLISNFYTPYNTGNTSTPITGNADITGNTKAAASTSTLVTTSIRFNTASAITLTLNGLLQTGGILITPNVGANNINISGPADDLASQATTGGTAGELITYQNNPLGFLNINTGLSDSNNPGTTYTQAGAGTVVLGGSDGTVVSTYTGQTYLDNGVTEIATNADIGTAATAATLNLQGGALIASSSIALDSGGGANPRPINVLSQGGNLAAAGTNTLTVDGAITGSGPLTIGIATIAGSGSGTANTTAVTGIHGTVLLTGGAANTYSGGTTVADGTLRVDGATSGTGTGIVTVTGTNAYLIGSGTIASNVINKANAHIDPGDVGIGTLTMAGLTLNNNSILDYDFTPTSNDLINVTGTNGLIINATAGINVDQSGSTTSFNTPGTYDIFQVAGGSTANLANLKVLNPVAATTYTFGTSGNFVTLQIQSQSVNADWNSSAGGNWSDGAADQNGTDPNWTGGTAPFQPGDIANFLTTPGITSANTIDLNISETVGTINFNNTASYTIASTEGSVLTIDSGSISPGAITDSNGTHTIGVSVALSKAVNITVINPGDSLVISGAITGTMAIGINPTPMSGAGTIILTNANPGYSGVPTIDSGTLQIGNGGATGSFGTYGTSTLALTDNGTLSYDLSTTVTVTNRITGTGTLQQAGAGTLIVNHVDAMANTNITNGTLVLGVTGALGSSNINIASPGTLDINGKSPTFGALTGNGTIDNVSAGGAPTITFNSSSTSTFSGSILNTTGTVSVLQAGTGTLILSGASTYGGGTEISAGVIKAANNSAFGTGTVTVDTLVLGGLQLANSVNISNPIVANVGSNNNPFEDVPDPGASATLSGPITSTKDVRFGTSQTSSTLILTGNDTVGSSGSNIALARGNIIFAGNNTFVNGATATPLVVGRFSTTSSLNVTIQDNAVVTSASGVSLGGLNGTTDDATVNLTLTGNGTLNTGPGLVDLNDNKFAAGVVDLFLSGTSTLATSGFTFLTSSGAATGMFFNGGTLTANASDPVGGQFFPNLSSTIVNSTLSVAVQSGGGTINNNGNNITIAEALQDGGSSPSDSMTYVGTGSTTLTNNNTYQGNSTIGDGTHATTVAIANTTGSALGQGIVTVNNNAVLTGNGSASGVVNVNSGGTVDPGVTGIATLSFGGMTLNTGSILEYEFGSGTNSFINLTDTDGLVVNGAGMDVFATGTNTPFAIPGTYDIMDVAGTSTANLANLSVLNGLARASYSFAAVSDGGTGTFIQLIIGNPAISSQWNNTGSGLWATSSNWTGPTPSFAGDTANFGANPPGISAPSTVTLGQTWTVGAITFSNSNSYTLGATGDTGSLVLNSGGVGAATITNSLGTHSINAPVSLTSSVNVSVTNPTDAIAIGGTIGGTGGITLAGAGSLILTGANTYSGGTTVNSGTLDVSNASGSATGTGDVTLNGGVLASDSGSISGNVLAGSGAHTIAPGGIGTVGSLTIGGLTSTSLTTLNFDLGAGPGPEVANGDLLTLGSGTVNIGSGTLLSFGGTPVAGDDYRLIGGAVGGINLANLTLPANLAGLAYSLSNIVDSGFIDLVVVSSGPASLTWTNASANNTWDTATSSNWNNGTSTTVFNAQDNVTFDDNNPGPGGTPANYAVTLNTTVTPGSVTVNNSAGDYTISGAGTIGGTGSLTKSGSGILTLSTANTYSGGTIVNAGILKILPTGPTTSALPNGALSITGNGIVQLATNVTLGSQPTSTPASNINLTSLSITGNGTLDINNNHIIIDYAPGNDPIASIAALIDQGANLVGGVATWTGTGITSTAAMNNSLSYGIGYADAADPGNPAGLAIGQIEIAYTLLGDANLDGKVNGTDFNILATNFNTGGDSWDQGDFTYDGKVNGSDFNLLAQNFNQGATQSALGAADAAALSAFSAANGLVQSNVPEPASMGLLTLASFGVLARRRRKQ